jgi:2-amino-4-hydroxy-6-hydroxymethyldihydropteridine diphosphokinase
MTRAALGLGSNLGDRRGQLITAVAALHETPWVRVIAVSPVYETVPVGGPEQGDYLNLVVVVETVATANDLLLLAHTLERSAGRSRKVRFGPRTLDVDVLAFGDTRSDDPGLTLPHPRVAERPFVLQPWADIDPTFEIPTHGAVGELAAVVGANGVRRLGALAATS